MKAPSPAGQLRRGAAAVRPADAPGSSGVAGWFGAEGRPFPPGQSWVERDQAYNFVLYSEDAARVTLLLYGEHDLVRPLLEFPLDPLVHKLRTLWFCKVPRGRVPDARYYAYSIAGPSPGAAATGHAFDPEKVLLDPYARDVSIWCGVGPDVDLGHDSHSLAYCLHGASRGDDLYVMINAYWEPLSFAIQEGRPGQWRRVLDTSRNSPDDIAEPGEEPVVAAAEYLVQPRSIVVLKRREPGPA